MNSEKAIELINDLTDAVSRVEREAATKRSGVSQTAIKKLQKQLKAAFKELTGREPTDDEFKQMWN